MVIWLINPLDNVDRTVDFVGGADVRLPTLFDDGGALYQGYPRAEGQAFAPFPVHVIIGPQGVVRYLEFQYDAGAVRSTIDTLLEEQSTGG